MAEILKCSNCIHRLVCGHRNCSFEFRNDMKLCGDDVEICIGNDKPFYSDVEICFEGDEPLFRGKSKIEQLIIIFGDIKMNGDDKHDT